MKRELKIPTKANVVQEFEDFFHSLSKADDLDKKMRDDPIAKIGDHTNINTSTS